MQRYIVGSFDEADKIIGGEGFQVQLNKSKSCMKKVQQRLQVNGEWVF